mmetsp:Transcript_17168/g.49684  ORF Transcript_17168/g.49684 Transcript_17168/m.49684 type:complete len:263 (-) Transcript_17168:1235-2023(-)
MHGHLFHLNQRAGGNVLCILQFLLHLPHLCPQLLRFPRCLLFLLLHLLQILEQRGVGLCRVVEHLLRHLVTARHFDQPLLQLDGVAVSIVTLAADRPSPPRFVVRGEWVELLVARSDGLFPLQRRHTTFQLGLFTLQPLQQVWIGVVPTDGCCRGRGVRILRCLCALLCQHQLSPYFGLLLLGRLNMPLEGFQKPHRLPEGLIQHLFRLILPSQMFLGQGELLFELGYSRVRLSDGMTEGLDLVQSFVVVCLPSLGDLGQFR